jgi:hypothetical protein
VGYFTVNQPLLEIVLGFADSTCFFRGATQRQRFSDWNSMNHEWLFFNRSRGRCSVPAPEAGGIGYA